jgi:hypothetical protein
MKMVTVTLFPCSPARAGARPGRSNWAPACAGEREEAA